MKNLEAFYNLQCKVFQILYRNHEEKNRERQEVVARADKNKIHVGGIYLREDYENFLVVEDWGFCCLVMPVQYNFEQEHCHLFATATRLGRTAVFFDRVGEMPSENILRSSLIDIIPDWKVRLLLRMI